MPSHDQTVSVLVLISGFIPWIAAILFSRPGGGWSGGYELVLIGSLFMGCASGVLIYQLGFLSNNSPFTSVTSIVVFFGLYATIGCGIYYRLTRPSS